MRIIKILNKLHLQKKNKTTKQNRTNKKQLLTLNSCGKSALSAGRRDPHPSQKRKLHAQKKNNVSLLWSYFSKNSRGGCGSAVLRGKEALPALRSLGCSSRSPSVPPSAPEQRIKATLNSVTRHYQRNCIIELKTVSREVADKKEKKVVIKKNKKNTGADITARAATVRHAAAGARDLKIPAQY